MKRPHNYLIAIAPVPRGFGYIVLTRRGTPVDWRVKEIKSKKHKNARCVVEADKFVEQYCAEVLVIEDCAAQGSKRRKRVKELLALLTDLAVDHGMGIVRYGPRDVRATFSLPPRANKDQVAKAVAERLPALAPRLPKIKRLWETERYVMA